MNQLTVRDRLYLLAHDEQGQPRIHGPSLSLGLSGAVLIDLALLGRITADSTTIGIRGSDPTGDGISDSVVNALLHSGRHSRDLRGWIRSLAVDVTERTRGGLHAAGLVRQVVRKRAFRGAKTLYPPVEPRLTGEIVGAARYAANGSTYVDTACMALCGLIGVLRLESTLGIDMSTAQLLSRLSAISARCGVAAQHITATVEELVGDQATAAFR